MFKLETILLAAGLYVVGLFCEGAGYHRLWSHKAYQARFPLALLLALFGAGNFNGSILNWARNHRAHHRHRDSPKDPFNRKNGFYYAFLGHYFAEKPKYEDNYVADLEKDSIVVFQSNFYFLLAIIVGLIFPTAIATRWNDPMGGFLIAGVLRIVLFNFFQSLFWALGRTFGRSPYNESNYAKNSWFISLCTLGEGYLNFHYEFPSDYRIGCFYYHFDAIKWILRLFSLLGLAHKFNKTEYIQILRIRIQLKQGKLDSIKKNVKFGPEPESLPVWTQEEFNQKVANGAQLIIIDNIAHDVKEFFQEHPGGEEVLKPKIGKDATIAFNGGVQRHSKAARNLAAFMRVAVVQKVKKVPQKKEE